MQQPPPRHVVFVIDNLECGGAQQLLVPFTRYLVANGSRVTVCSLQPRTEMSPRLEAAGAEVVLQNRARPGIAHPLRLARYVYGSIRDIMSLAGSECVVSAHLSDAEFLSAFAGLLRRRWVVTATIHTPKLLPRRSALDPRNGLRRLATWLLYNRMDWVVCVSDEIAAVMKDVFAIKGQRLRVILNGIDTQAYDVEEPPNLRRELGLPEDATVFTSIARLAVPKNPVMAVQALALLRKRGRNAALLFVGEGELRSEVEKTARTLGVEDRVVLAGFRNDIPELLAMSDCYCITSVFEGTSLSMLEAMAAGKPLVATEIPGVVEVVRHERNGLLAPSEDAAAFADAMERIMDEPDFAEQLGVAAKETILQQFDMSHMVEAYAALWNTPNR